MHTGWYATVLTLLIALCGCTAEQAPAPAPAPPAPKFPKPDMLQATARMISFEPPSSPWQETQKTRFGQLLGSSKADLLVVPVQVQHAAFDRVERMLMSTRLALHLQHSLGMSLADPFMVARALGEGQRTLRQSDVLALADRLQSKLVVWIFVGHDQRGKMMLTLQAQERGAQGGWSIPRQQDWPDLAFADQRLPSTVLVEMAPQIDAFLRASRRATDPVAVPAAGSLPLPQSPLAAVDGAQSSPVVDAYHLQLLGVFCPARPTLCKERLFIRSLLILDRVAADSPDRRLLAARALFHLRRRPAALAALGAPQTPAELALRAALDGDLPALEREAARIESPLAFDRVGGAERLARRVRAVEQGAVRAGGRGAGRRLPRVGLAAALAQAGMGRLGARQQSHAQGVAGPSVPGGRLLRRKPRPQPDGAGRRGPRSGAPRAVGPGACRAPAAGEARGLVL